MSIFENINSIENVKILVIDDNLKNLQITAKILVDEGYLVSLAQEGKTALSLLEEEFCDLILLDVMMPEIDGFEVCKRLKSSDRLKNIPVIFLTAKSNPDDLVEGFKVGAVDYVFKPFKKEELLMRVKTHVELALSRKKILELNKNRDKLYSIIAHDIRSPFNSIIQIIEAIENRDIEIGSELFTQIIRALKKNTYETRSLINNLLEWSKLQGGTISLKPTSVNISTVVNDCVSLLKRNAELKKISIEENISSNITSYCDEISLHTVLRNLLSNAIKFTPDEGRIQFNCISQDKWVFIQVKDNGVGMSSETINKIMKEQSNYTTIGTKNERGSGLGLYFVKDFIERNNGELTVQSKIGEGTTFTVKLPI